MAVPTAPTEGGGNGVLFLTHDVGGTNTPGLFRGVVPRTVNGTILSYVGIATHADAQAWTAGDPVVLNAVYDPTGAGTVRKMVGDGTGRLVSRPLGAYNNAGSNAFGHPLLVGQTTLNTEAVGWLAFATHKGGAAVGVAADGVVVMAGVNGGNAKPLAADGGGRLLADPALVLGGSGQKTVTASAAALRASAACRKVRLTTNGGSAAVYVGVSGVTTTTGYQLTALTTVEIEVLDVANVFVIGTSGSVSFLWFV